MLTSYPPDSINFLKISWLSLFFLSSLLCHILDTNSSANCFLASLSINGIAFPALPANVPAPPAMYLRRSIGFIPIDCITGPTRDATSCGLALDSIASNCWAVPASKFNVPLACVGIVFASCLPTEDFNPLTKRCFILASFWLCCSLLTWSLCGFHGFKSAGIIASPGDIKASPPRFTFLVPLDLLLLLVEPVLVEEPDFLPNPISDKVPVIASLNVSTVPLRPDFTPENIFLVKPDTFSLIPLTSIPNQFSAKFSILPRILSLFSYTDLKRPLIFLLRLSIDLSIIWVILLNNPLIGLPWSSFSLVSLSKNMLYIALSAVINRFSITALGALAILLILVDITPILSPILPACINCLKKPEFGSTPSGTPLTGPLNPRKLATESNIPELLRRSSCFLTLPTWLKLPFSFSDTLLLYPSLSWSLSQLISWESIPFINPI